jgi:RHS repeat-associated protein
MTHDLNGNTLNDSTNSYTWDARNPLVSADSNAASFAYDPFGRRVGKTLLAGSTNFLYDGANPVQELSGSTVTANLLTGSLDERFLGTTATDTDNYLTDALGSTVALTGTTGSSEAEYSYGPFASMSITGSTTNSYNYTGRETYGLGINYYRARYYNPAIGRFLSEDPLGFAGSGANFYAYAGDDPIDFNDPFGLKPGPPPPPCPGEGGTACTPVPCSQTAGFRVAQGILGAANLALAAQRTGALLSADSLLAVATPFTSGGSAAVAGVVTVYGVVSIGGQVISGAGQLYTAFGGNAQAGAQLSQAGDILSGPLFGLSTLMVTNGNAAQAQQSANLESAITAGAGLVNNTVVSAAVNFGVSLFGLSGAGCHP